MSDKPRMFSEKEAAELVVKAAKLQEDSNSGSDYSPGISMDELMRMAQDVGVDEHYLREALRGTPEAHQTAGFRFLGVPLSTEFERIVDGELAPENFDLISEQFFKPGSFGGRARGLGQGLVPMQVGRTMQGQVQSGTAFGPLRVTSRNGRTRIWAKQTMFVPFMTAMYPSLLVSFILTMATFASAKHPIPYEVGATVIGAILTVGSLVFRRMLQGGTEKMKILVDSAADAIRDETVQDRQEPLVEAAERQESLEQRLSED